MKVFSHHMYEYKKGLRNLVLHTVGGDLQGEVERRLGRAGIACEIYRLHDGRCNVFFGADACVDVIRAIGKPSLRDYTPEEDFMVGIMLGYCRVQQCDRYLALRQRRRNRGGATENCRVLCAERGEEDGKERSVRIA